MTKLINWGFIIFSMFSLFLSSLTFAETVGFPPPVFTIDSPEGWGIVSKDSAVTITSQDKQQQIRIGTLSEQTAKEGMDKLLSQAIQANGTSIQKQALYDNNGLILYPFNIIMENRSMSGVTFQPLNGIPYMIICVFQGKDSGSTICQDTFQSLSMTNKLDYTQSLLKELAFTIELHQAGYNAYPDTLQMLKEAKNLLTKKPFLDDFPFSDAWGQAFYYSSDGQNFTLKSLGKDGKESLDDIVYSKPD